MERRSLVAEVVGPMPPFYEVAEAVWGQGVDFDSDGDSDDPESRSWRELTVSLRPDHQQRLDIDPHQGNLDRLAIRATSREVLDRASSYLIAVGAIQIKS